jgi:sugar phosphate isomerase/epimerase
MVTSPRAEKAALRRQRFPEKEFRMSTSPRSTISSTASRRTFLGTLGRGAALLAAAPLALGAEEAKKDTKEARAQKDPWPLRLSTSSNHFLRLPIEKACARIAALGYKAVDIWSAYQGCPHLDDVLTRLGADGLKKVLEEHKLELFAFSVYVGGYPKYAELLGKAGGGVAIQGSAEPCKPEELTTRMKAFLESLKPLAELAAKHRTRLAIENHGNALLDGVDSMKAFVDLNTSPHLGLALAPYHVQARGDSVERAIETCGKQLLFFYAWQHAEGTKQLPGEGPTDFLPWVAALRKIRYAGYLNAFMHGDMEADEMAKLLGRSKDYLKACHEKTAG